MSSVGIGEVRRNLRRIQIFRALMACELIFAVLVPFLQQNGLSQIQVSLAVDSMMLWALVVTIPSGKFADLYGRKWVMAAGSVSLTFSYLVYALGNGFWPVIYAFSLAGIGYGCTAGADRAMAYDLMKQVGWEGKYRRFEANAVSYRMVGLVLGSLVGTWLYQEWGTKTAFWLQILVYLAATWIALCLREPARVARSFQAERVGPIIRYTLHRHKELGWLIIYMAIVWAGIGAAGWLRPLYYQAADISIGWFGVLQAALVILGALAALFADKVECFGRWKVLRLFVVASGAGYLTLALHPSAWMLVALGMLSIVFGLFVPITNNHINQLVESEVRATALSVADAVNKVGLCMMLLLSGWVVDAFSLSMAFLVLAVLCGSIGIYALRRMRRAAAV